MTRSARRSVEVTDYEILNALAQAPEPVATTTEVAGLTTADCRSTLDRLKTLLREGSVETRKLPAGWVWRLTEQGQIDLDALELSHQTRRNCPGVWRSPQQPDMAADHGLSSQRTRGAE